MVDKPEIPEKLAEARTYLRVASEVFYVASAVLRDKEMPETASMLRDQAEMLNAYSIGDDEA